MVWRKRGATASQRLAMTLVLVGLAATVLAGCFGGSDAPAGAEAIESQQAPESFGPWVQVISDPEGDANHRATTTVDDLTPCVTAPSLPDQPTTCGVERPWHASDATQVGPSAGPERDLLGVSIQDSARSLRIRFEMATVPEDLSVLADEGAGEATSLALTWSASGPCTLSAYFEVFPGIGIRAVPSLVAFCDPPAGPDPAAPRVCEAIYCVWPIGMETEPGTPGGIVLDVPRHLLSSGDPNEGLRDLVAYVDLFRYSSGTTGRFSAEGAVNFWGFAPSGGFWSPIDDATAAAGTTYAYSSPWHDPQPDLTPVAPRILKEPAGLDASDRQTLILGLDLVVDAAEVVLEVAVDEVADVPEDHGLMVAAMVGPQLIVTGYTAQDGVRTPFANHQPRPGSDFLSVPVDVDLDAGRPGHVLFRFDRGTLGSIEDGAVLGGLFGWSFEATSEDATVGGTTVWRHQETSGIFHVSETRTMVTVPQTETVVTPGVHLGDMPWDVAAPLDLTRPSRHYELLGLDISSPDPDRIQFALAVADLSDLSPPDGYDAVFYGVGVEHPHGRTMLGHYRSDDRPGGEFLCAPDITVLPEAPTDPTLTGWETIPGRVLDATTTESVNTGASAGGSSLVLLAPRSCFALADTDTALNVTDLAAGSYLVRRAPVNSAGNTDVVLLDALEDNGAFDIAFGQARQVPAVAPSFWAQPFGVQNFWDIFGVAIAIAFAVMSATIIVRKRVRMKRYLVRLEDLADHHHDDPERYAQELVALRKRLHRDLLDNRLTEGHFVMIEERLRSSLSGTRINAFGHAFYDLPPALMIRLQSLLADGRFSRHDHAVLKGLVTKLKIPQKSRRSVHAQLDLWANQDADVARLAKTHKERRWWRREKAAA